MLRALALLGAVALAATAAADSGATYSGRAVVAHLTFNETDVRVGSSGELYPSGGARRTFISVEEPGYYEVHAAVGITEGRDLAVRSFTIAGGLRLWLGATTIAADAVHTRADAACIPGGGASAWGTVEVTNLTVNGQPVSVTGAPHQEVPLPSGVLVLNEHVHQQTPQGASHAVTGLRVHTPVLAETLDVLVGHARAGMTCPQPSG